MMVLRSVYSYVVGNLFQSLGFLQGGVGVEFDPRNRQALGQRGLFIAWTPDAAFHPLI